MRISARAKKITDCVRTICRRQPESRFDEPRGLIDLIVFHKLHFYMAREAASRTFVRLKRYFVDWNEVRVSSVRELVRILAEAEDPLALAAFVKDLLAYLHARHHRLDREFLDGWNVTEIRRYLRKIRGIEPSTVDLVLWVKKDYPVVPVEEHGRRAMVRLGLVPASERRDRIQRYLHDLVGDDEVFSFHRFFIDHGRSVCIEDEEELECSRCRLRRPCSYYAKLRRRSRNGRHGVRRDRSRRSRLR